MILAITLYLLLLAVWIGHRNAHDLTGWDITFTEFITWLYGEAVSKFTTAIEILLGIATVAGLIVLIKLI